MNRELIITLLRNLGSRHEIERYLATFASVEQPRFAMVKVSGGLLASQPGELAGALSFLHAMGLIPVVLHDALPQVTYALELAGVTTEHVAGVRVTSAPILAIARKVIQKVNLDLVAALDRVGTRARPIVTGVFQATPMEDPRLGLVGTIEAVHLDAISASISAGYVPILSALGETSSGQILDLDSDAAARALAHALQPHKIIFLTESGGLRDGHDQLIDAINLIEDQEPLLAQPWLDDSTRRTLTEIARLLADLPATSSVSITSPAYLARELFTHRGSGTLVRQGEAVRVYDRFEDIDVDRLRQLIELAFARPLAADYFADKKPHRIYLTDSYRAGAIVTRTGPGDIPYLDKFAVTREGQGVGVGGSLWRRIVAENPSLFWRARIDNPVNPWYFSKADGAVRSPSWVVFWYGIKGYQEIEQCVQHALALPATLASGARAEVEHARE